MHVYIHLYVYAYVYIYSCVFMYLPRYMHSCIHVQCTCGIYEMLWNLIDLYGILRLLLLGCFAGIMFFMGKARLCGFAGPLSTLPVLCEAYTSRSCPTIFFCPGGTQDLREHPKDGSGWQRGAFCVLQSTNQQDSKEPNCKTASHQTARLVAYKDYIDT